MATVQSITAQILFIAALIIFTVPLISSYKKSDILPLFGSPLSSYPPKGDTHVRVPGNTFYQTAADQALLARLLDIGAQLSSTDQSVSYVPPLDGKPPRSTVDSYFMTFVPYDIKLVSIKNLDPLGSSFTIQWQMIMQWVDITSPSNNVTNNCIFVCDTTDPGSDCCDTMWAPSLQIPQCNVDSIDSIVDVPSVVWYNPNISNAMDCFKSENIMDCYQRKFWKLNIQTTCDAQLNFENFPFDIQQLTMEILNPYASRTWMQLVKGTLLNNGGNIVNGHPPPEQYIPSWYIEDVLVSLKCDVSTWHQTFSAQNSFLQINQSAYESQEQIIQDTLSNLMCADYANLEVSSVSLANPANLSLYDIIQTDYMSRLESTLLNDESCRESKGKEYILPPIQILDNRSLEIEKVFGNWLNVSKDKHTKISFECLIQAVTNLTTPTIALSIVLKRFRTFYVLKLVVPTAACGIFTFSVIAIDPHNLADRLAIIVPSALTLAALQIAVVATDIPAVAYTVPTSFMVIFTYGAQILVTFESIGFTICLKLIKRKKVRRTSSSRFRNQPREPDEIQLAARAATRPSTPNISAEPDHEVSDEVMNPRRPRGYSRMPKPDEVNHHSWTTSRCLDIFVLLTLAVLYAIALLLCLLIPYNRGNSVSTINGTSIWSK